jgi:hypothetical protein
MFRFRFPPARRCAAAMATTFVVLLCLSSSRATLTPQWVSVPISEAAINADPTLANYRSYDLRVTQSSDHWCSGDLEVTLNSGHFYVPPSGDQTFAKSNLWNALPNSRLTRG